LADHPTILDDIDLVEGRQLVEPVVTYRRSCPPWWR